MAVIGTNLAANAIPSALFDGLPTIASMSMAAAQNDCRLVAAVVAAGDVATPRVRTAAPASNVIAVALPSGPDVDRMDDRMVTP